jgi:hypothetical protein
LLFRRETLDGIASGTVTLAFRRWKRPGAKAGGATRTQAGVVRFGTVETIEAAALTEADAKRSGFRDLAALKEMLGPDDGNPVYRIELKGIEADARETLRETASFTDAEWEKLAARFARWEKERPGYFPGILKLIGARPATVSTELAKALGAERFAFKQDVRKLKELGLTESLDIGYRLSPRGEAVLRKFGKSRA